MDQLLFGLFFLVPLGGLVALGAYQERERQREQWSEPARRHGLELHLGWFGGPKLRGTIGGRAAVVSFSEEGAAVTVPDVPLPDVAAGPQGVAESLRQQLVADPDPQLGDPPFDRAYHLTGELPVLVGILSGRVRRVLLGPGSLRLRVRDGTLVVRTPLSSPEGVDAGLELVDALLQAAMVPEQDRLAALVGSDPSHGVRRTALSLLAARLLDRPTAAALLDSRSPAVARAGALDALLDRGGPAGAIALVLGSSDAPTVEAVVALAERRRVPGLEPVLAALVDVRDRAVARAASRALERLRAGRVGGLSLALASGGEVSELE